MIQIKPLSQRDSTLKGKLLGSSDLTLWGFGCVVTSFTMFVNYVSKQQYTVDQINALLVNGGAFYNNSLLWWEKVPQAIPYMQFQWRGWTYDNNKVSDYIYNKGLPVIVQVDAAPIGAPRSDHFVLYIGDGKIADPWDGQIKSVSAYPNPKGYILYTVDVAKLPTGNGDALSACLVAHQTAVKAANEKDETIKQLRKEINDHIETEKRLRDEKDIAVRDLELRLATANKQRDEALANTSIECQKRHKAKISRMKVDVTNYINAYDEQL